MKRGLVSPMRPQGPVCQLCDFIAGRHLSRSKSLRHTLRITSNIRFSTTTSRFLTQSPNTKVGYALPRSVQSRNYAKESIPSSAGEGDLDARQLNERLEAVIAARDELFAKPSVPSEDDVDKVLKLSGALAETLTGPKDSIRKKGSEASALLSLNESTNKATIPEAGELTPAKKEIIQKLSEVNFSIMDHPPIFITPRILRKYVHIQEILGKPEELPLVFDLFATKPIPREGSSPIQYTKQKPSKVSNAISKSVADRALAAAIKAKNLQVAVDIVETTYATTAYKRAKAVRQLLFPAAGVLSLPLALYAIAGRLSEYQATMDPTMATNLAFTGMLIYVGCTATIGYVAITTSNDQMERVTWAPGIPLSERWFREEERAAIDRIACAWGFREKWRRGEEEGPDWDALREWIGMRGMLLDVVDHMEGME